MVCSNMSIIIVQIMREQVENEGVKTDGDDEPQSSGYIFAPVSVTVS